MSTYDRIFPLVFSKYCRQPGGPVIKKDISGLNCKQGLILKLIVQIELKDTLRDLPPDSSPQRY